MLRLSASAAALALSVTFALDAAAQSQASSTGKGITGGALLGAETVMITEAALGVRPAWAYLVGGAAGAAGGGVGGYFLETTSARTNMIVLAAGMALVIPTTVAVLSATAYEPPVEYTEDRGPIDQPAEEPPEPEDSVWAPEETRRTSSYTSPTWRDRPTGLVGVTDHSLLLGFPAIRVADVFDETERATFGVTRETELLVSVLDVRF